MKSIKNINKQDKLELSNDQLARKARKLVRKHFGHEKYLIVKGVRFQRTEENHNAISEINNINFFSHDKKQLLSIIDELEMEISCVK